MGGGGGDCGCIGCGICGGAMGHGNGGLSGDGETSGGRCGDGWMGGGDDGDGWPGTLFGAAGGSGEGTAGGGKGGEGGTGTTDGADGGGPAGNSETDGVAGGTSFDSGGSGGDDGGDEGGGDGGCGGRCGGDDGGECGRGGRDGLSGGGAMASSRTSHCAPSHPGAQRAQPQTLSPRGVASPGKQRSDTSDAPHAPHWRAAVAQIIFGQRSHTGRAAGGPQPSSSAPSLHSAVPSHRRALGTHVPDEPVKLPSAVTEPHRKTSALASPGATGKAPG